MRTRLAVLLFLLTSFSINVISQTSLSGTFSVDSTLSKSKSPYSLTGTLTIKNNATLIIENGCVINMGGYNIIIGSSSAGKIIADEVSFSTTLSSEKTIGFKDGGIGTITRCNFNKVHIRVEDDAGSECTFTSNIFSNIKLPIIISPATEPVISGNSGPVQLIGLYGTVKQSKTLKKYEWNYQISGPVNVQNSATLTLQPNTVIDLLDNLLNIGNSSAGTLIANNSTFTSTYKYGSKIVLKDGGGATFSGCSFNHIPVTIESDASDNINISNNSFSNISFPIELDINRTPVISGNTSTVEKISVKGTLNTDLALTKYEWDYYLGGTLYISKSKTLIINNGINIDLNKYFISVGNSTAGKLVLSNSTLTSSYTKEGYIYFRDEGTGQISNCIFNHVNVKIEDDAGDDISVTGNQFSNVIFPVLLSVNKSPVISGNTCEVNKIGLLGNVTHSNNMPKYDWDFQLSESVIVKSNSTLQFTESSVVDLANYSITLSSGSTSTGFLNATNVLFRGMAGNRGKINFNINSGGNLSNCRFEKTYIKIDNSTPQITNSRFYRCETAIEIRNAANPTLSLNDFYNNITAILHNGTENVVATNNFWGHSTGPQHPGNLDGIGEKIAGNISFIPFKTNPNTGTIEGQFSPVVFNLGQVSTGEKTDTFFTVTNNGDLDFMIHEITTNSSRISVKSLDRFWLQPDSVIKIAFSFTSLDDGIQNDTIIVSNNNTSSEEQLITVNAIGNIDSLKINFNKLEIDSFPVIKFYFTVTDQADIPIGDIIKEFITLKEDDVQITDFEFISRKDISTPVAAALVIDRSGSMTGQPLRDAKSAAIDFVNELAPNDIAAVFSFNEKVYVNKKFTSDKNELIQAIGYLSSIGETAIFDAIALAIDSVKNKPGNKAVIAITDGLDNRSSVTPDVIVGLALQYGISIYTIGLGPDAESSTIQYIANLTGGDYYYAPTSEQLAIIYRRISGQLQNQYLIRYTAPVNNPFPRCIQLTVDFAGLSVTDSIKYTTQKQNIHFITDSKPFCLNTFYKNSRTYFYYQVDDTGNILDVDEEFMFVNKSGSVYIPMRGKYLGNGIFQFRADLVKGLNRSKIQLNLPDSIIHNGSYINFINKPAPVEIPLLNYPVTENIDVFASGTVGGTVLAGGVGAGPSIAAASLSVKGSAGMGLNFEQDADGNEAITRRFEAGVGTQVESPAINGVVGSVQAGAQANLWYKGTLGQTMKFPENMDNNAVKAKTLYLLETFSLGALSLSPDCSVLKYALKESLSLLDGGMIDAYNTYYYCNLYGLNIEGEASLGFSIASGKGSKQNKLKLAEVGGQMVFSGQFIDYTQTNEKSINFGYALNAGFSLLSLDVMGVDLGMLAGYTAGCEFGIGANFAPAFDFQSVDLSIGLNQTEQIVFGQLYQSREISFNVPQKVITRALSSENLISSIAPFFSESSPKYDFQIGKDYFLNSIDNMFTHATGPLDNIDDHIVIEVTDTKTNVIEIDATVKVDAAVIIGGGLELGITMSYADEKSAVTSQSTLVNGKLFPLADYNSPGEINLFSIKDEVEFLFDNAPKLVADLINAFIENVIEAFETGAEFLLESVDGGCTFLGNIASDTGGTFVEGLAELASYSSELPFINKLKGAFLEPEIIEGYMSKKVITSTQNGVKNEETENQFLCVISNCYRINIYDDNDSLMPVFSPSVMSIAINQAKVTQFGFGEDEKTMASIFYYDFESLNWIEIPGDLNEHPDTVSTTIERSGTYAIGVLYQPANDKKGPDILNYYPENNGIYDPDSVFSVHLFEPLLGVGVNPASCTIEIDGQETEVLWDPINNILSGKLKTNIEKGLHSMKITATDFNGNQTISNSLFTVTRTTDVSQVTTTGFDILCYPNPVSQSLNITLSNCNNNIYSVSIYNNLGQKIKNVYNEPAVNSIIQTSWNRTDDNGNIVPAGIYFVRVLNNERIYVKTIIAK
ncbi:MAG: VWA domain-containing protein [Draconibacterium sp.]